MQLAARNPYDILPIYDSSETSPSSIVDRNLQEGGSPKELGGPIPMLNSPLKDKSAEVSQRIVVRNLTVQNEIFMDIGLSAKGSNKVHPCRALLHSGANGVFIDRAWADSKGLPLTQLPYPLTVYNVDGTKNTAGDITHSTIVSIDYKGHLEEVTAEVTELGRTPFILGYTWLHKHNPEVNWKEGSLRLSRCPISCYKKAKSVKVADK